MRSSAGHLFALAVGAALLSGSFSAAAAPPTDSDRRDARALLDELIAIPTAKGRGQVPVAVDAIVARLQAGGFSAEDIVRTPIQIEGEPTMGLLVRYRGKIGTKKKAVAFLAHMDVVDAIAANWGTDPYKPIEKDGYLYGRGSQDNKFGVALLVTTFIRLKRDGYVPDRDLVLAFAGDEETGMLTTRENLKNAWLKNVDFALNSDAGGASMRADGTPVSFDMQAAEKTSTTFEITAVNAGGHSSVPRADNAIYDLADAMKRVQAYRFPVEFNEISRLMVKRVATQKGGEIGSALNLLLRNPSDKAAADVAARFPDDANLLWTTCVATMLRGGNAPNALPQNATATVNCRIMPGTSADQVKAALAAAIGNDRIAIKQIGESVESPASPIRPDVVAAIQKAVAANYPGFKIEPAMSSGGTEGREYRRVGIPTYGAGSLAMVRPVDSRAHGTDERLPLVSFNKELLFWDVLVREAGGTGR